MKTLLFLALIFSATLAQAGEHKIIGTYQSTLSDALNNIPESMKSKLVDSFEKMKQTFTITEKELTLNVAAAGSGIHMSYTVQGDFILGKMTVGTNDMYYALYIKDDDTLYFAGQKFVRAPAK